MKSAYRANVFILFLMTVTVFGSLVFSFFYQIFQATPPHWVRAVLQYVLLFGCTICLFVHFTGLSLKDLGFRAPARPWISIPAVLLLAFLVQPPLMLISHLCAQLFPDPVAASMEQIVKEPFILSVFSSALLPALFEETACRGLYLYDLSDRRPMTAALFSGLVFALLHLNFQQMPYAFCFGTVIALTAVYTGSILLPILAHLLINTTQLILSYRSIFLFPNTRTLVTAALLCLPPAVGLLVLLRAGRARQDYQPLKLDREWMPLLYAILLFLCVSLLLH